MRKASVVTLLAALALAPAAPAFAADGVPVSVDSAAAVDVANQSGTTRLNAIVKTLENTPLITPVLKGTVYHPESEAALVEQLNSETAASLELALVDWSMQEDFVRGQVTQLAMEELKQLIAASQVTTAVDQLPSFGGDKNHQLGVLSVDENTMVMEVGSGEDLAYTVTATKSPSGTDTWDFTSNVTKGSPELPGAYFVYEVAPGGSIQVTDGFASTNLKSPDGESASADVLNNPLDQPVHVLVAAVNGTQVTGSGLTLAKDQTSPIAISTAEQQFPELVHPLETYVDYTLHVAGAASVNPDINHPGDSIPEDPAPVRPTEPVVDEPAPADPTPTAPAGPINPDANNPGDSIPEDPAPARPTEPVTEPAPTTPAPTTPATPEGPVNPDTNNPGDSIPEDPTPPTDETVTPTPTRPAIGNPNPSMPKPTEPPATEETPVTEPEATPKPVTSEAPEAQAPETPGDTSTDSGGTSTEPGSNTTENTAPEEPAVPSENQTITEEAPAGTETPVVTEVTTVEEHIANGINDEVRDTAEQDGAKMPVVTTVNSTGTSTQSQQPTQDRKVLIETALAENSHKIPAPAQIVIGGLGLLAAMVISGMVLNRKKNTL